MILRIYPLGQLMLREAKGLVQGHTAGKEDRSEQKE